MSSPTIRRRPSNLTLPLMERVLLPVDKLHIIKGLRCSANLCPIALALMDVGLHKPSVLPNSIQYTDNDGQRWKAHMDDECKAWIRRYDAGGSMKPTVIELKGIFESEGK